MSVRTTLHNCHMRLWELIAIFGVKLLHNTAPEKVGVVIIYYGRESDWIGFGTDMPPKQLSQLLVNASLAVNSNVRIYPPPEMKRPPPGASGDGLSD